jgi:hypothetical protein
MIQELLGGSGLIAGERKISSPSPAPSPSSSSTTTTTSDNQSLRCPRCDSSNTKFCYYNNYNLTQPRHFCKTCRRYWTKGGALRNVPIGGGCRKNKTPTMSASVGKSSSGKMKTISSEIGRSGGLGSTGFDPDLPSSPILWGSPQNSHLLALLRATQNPNPSPNPLTNSVNVKEEGNMVGSHMMSTDPAVATGGLNARGFDPLGQVPSLGLCSSFWRNNQLQAQPQNGFVVAEVQNSGIQELYQRLRSSSTNFYPDHHSPMVLGNMASSSSSSSSILESTSVAGVELGYWNPAFSWSDLPTTNGAYP